MEDLKKNFFFKLIHNWSLCVLPVWRMMNFRQRMGWLGVALYLLLSAAAVYYIFEVHTVSVEHIPQEGGASTPSPPPVWYRRIGARLPPLPAWTWAPVFLLPYLQLFLFLFSCTRADPQAVGYCVLPVCLALLCSRRRHLAARKPANHREPPLIDTWGFAECDVTCVPQTGWLESWVGWNGCVFWRSRGRDLNTVLLSISSNVQILLRLRWKHCTAGNCFFTQTLTWTDKNQLVSCKKYLIK